MVIFHSYVSLPEGIYLRFKLLMFKYQKIISFSLSLHTIWIFNNKSRGRDYGRVIIKNWDFIPQEPEFHQEMETGTTSHQLGWNYYEAWWEMSGMWQIINTNSTHSLTKRHPNESTRVHLFDSIQYCHWVIAIEGLLSRTHLVKWQNSHRRR
jgi:hypothetical protein